MHLVRLTLPASLLASLLIATPVMASPLPALSATYSVPTPPTAIVQGASTAVSITVQNVGNVAFDVGLDTPLDLQERAVPVTSAP